MSNTPRTDAAAMDSSESLLGCSLQLERELAAERAYVEKEHVAAWNKVRAVLPEPADGDQRSLCQRVIDAILEGREGSADKARLDWLDRAPIVRFIHLSQFCSIRDSARSAIDKAKESKYE